MRANSAKSREQLMCLAGLTLCYALSFMDRLCTGTRDNVYEETQARGVSKGSIWGWFFISMEAQLSSSLTRDVPFLCTTGNVRGFISTMECQGS